MIGILFMQLKMFKIIKKISIKRNKTIKKFNLFKFLSGVYFESFMTSTYVGL